MESYSTSRLGRKPPTPKQSDLYSTVVVHGNDDEDEQNIDAGGERGIPDIYATVVCKDNDGSPPPLVKRIPKDVCGGVPIDAESDNEGDSVSGTMIVKTSHRRPSAVTIPSFDRTERNRKGRIEGSGEEEDEEGDFSTVVMRRSEVESGTVMKRTSRNASGEDGGSSTMSRAVASMQSVVEVGIGRQRKGGSGAESSSFSDTVTREDPSTKYEILHELGKICFFLTYYS